MRSIKLFAATVAVALTTIAAPQAAAFSSGGSAATRALDNAQTTASVSNSVETVAAPVQAAPAAASVEVEKMASVTPGAIYEGSQDWSFLANSPVAMPGSKISTTSGKTCSVGYVAEYAEGMGIITAGHCGAPGEEFGVRNSSGTWMKVGTIVKSDNTDVADWALIKVENPALVSPSVPVNLSMGSTYSSSQAGEADAICVLGQVSGLSCGAFQYVAPSGRLVFEGVANHGDSGATVFALDNGVMHPIAILEGGYADSLNLASMPLEDVMPALGVTAING